MRRFFLWLAFILGVCGPVLGGPSERLDDVARELSHLYEASLRNLDSIELKMLFQHWREEDIAFFTRQSTNILRGDISDDGPVASVGYLMRFRSDLIFGLSGEVYGCSMMREKMANSALHFMNDAEYRTLNPMSYRNPDGLLYDATDSSEIIIFGVLESKIGFAARYETSQAQGYLDYWQERQKGVFVRTSQGKVRHYSPKKIFVLVDGIKTPIQFISKKDLERVTLLITHQNSPDFTGEIIRPPFSPADGRRILRDYFALLVGDRAVDATRDVPAPQIRTFDEESFQSLIERWVLANGVWPESMKASERDPEAVFLRHLKDEIKRHGGQSEVFVHYLSPKARELLLERGSIPAIESMYRLFRRARLVDHSILVAFRYYMDRYYPNQRDETVLRNLSLVNPAWSRIAPEDVPTRCQIRVLANEAA